MCDRSRWKPRAYCYSNKKIKSVSSTKWERQIPKELKYWSDFCQKEKSKLIVSKSSKNLPYFTVNHKYPRDVDSKDFDNVEERTMDEKIAIYESSNTSNFLNNANDTEEPVLPIITVLSSTPPGSSSKRLSPRENKFENTLGKNVASEKEYLPRFPRNDENFVRVARKNRETYTSGNCPLHRREPTTRIFDDDISRYLTNSSRVENTKPKEDEKFLLTKFCRKCRKPIDKTVSNSAENLRDVCIPESNEVKNDTFSKSIENEENVNESSNEPNSNIKGATSVSRMARLNDVKNERVLTSLVGRVDDIESSDDINYDRKGTTLVSAIYPIPELNDVDSKDSWNKLTLDEGNRNMLVRGPQGWFRSKNFQEYSNFKLPKCIKKRRSLIERDFDKYYVKYARKALKRVTFEKNQRFDPMIYEMREKGSRKHVSKSPGSTWSLDLELGGDLKDQESSLGHFLNRLPKLSYFPRRCQDRCLACLHRSVDDIVESEKEEKRKAGWLMQKTSIESDDSEVTLPESLFDDNSDLIDEIKIDDEEKFVGEEETKFLKDSRLKEKPEESSTSDKSKLESSNDKRLEVKTIPITSERSKISSSRSSSDEEKSSVLFPEENSKNSKYRAPCHAPTTLRPSLEPLRALRAKKSTSLGARVASNESTMISSFEDGKNVKSKTEDKERKVEVAKDLKKEEDSVPVKKILTKVRSVGDNLMDRSEDLTKKRTETLRRGSSCVNLETILQNFSKDTKLESLMEDGDKEKSSTMGRFFSREEIEETLKDLEERGSSSLDALTTLCDLFLKRVLEIGNVDKKRMRLIERLVRLLIDSRRYTKPEKFSLEIPSLTPSSEFFVQRPMLNPERLRSILPLDNYNLIAPLLGMPEHYARIPFSGKTDCHPIPLAWIQRSEKSESSPETGDDLVVHPPSSLKADSIEQSETNDNNLNPYALFLKKERRKVVTWRPLTEEDLRGYDPEATLRMRADKVTMKICKDFCKWLRSLGGAERDIDETVLKDMFEISFSADACKATQINVKEMATVPTDVASARLCKGSSVLAMTRKQVQRDVKAENETKRTLAFNTTLPIDLLFIPPKNHVQERWLDCKNVPRDIESMEVIWSGITELESVKGFLKWLHYYPDVNPPEILTQAKSAKRMWSCRRDSKRPGENKNV